MNATHDRAKSIFLNAVEITASEERLAFVKLQCAGDDRLRTDVNELLEHQQSLGSFLEPPAANMGAAIDPSPILEGPGTLIGPYKLIDQIGEGGFGVVFMAEQERPVRRKVALKIIKPGMDTRQVIARFEAERQALAMMDHPNIAKILDAGTTENGRPYFVMELVQGVPITEYCDQCNLTTRERLQLFITVCQAVQHAHQKGVIHRDIKPTNVLVQGTGSFFARGLAPFAESAEQKVPVPLSAGEKPLVKVIDFGVAKAIGQQLTEHTLMTAFAQIVGTPLYMSPEQAELSPLGVDTRSDIYSLGVLLYELLTGSTPLDKERLHAASYDELRRIAARYISRERPGQTLQATALVNEAFVRLSAERPREFQNRTHFLAIAALSMRQILVQRARARKAAKRGGAPHRITLDDSSLDPSKVPAGVPGMAAERGPGDIDVLALDEALTRLAALDPELARLVELRYFGGLTVEETADVLGSSPATVKRHWAFARAWLKQALEGQAPEIDPLVYLTDCDPSTITPGTFVETEIVGSRGYDLVARPLQGC